MTLGIIGGTALESLSLKSREEVVLETRWGAPSGTLWRGWLEETEVIFLNRHGDNHSLPPHGINYRANIAAFHQCGVRELIAVNAVGGITPEMQVGALVVPQQIIDYTWGRKHTYSDGPGDPLVQVDFTNPYSDELRSRLVAAAQHVHIPVIDWGVHGVVQGPRLETAAEIVRMERDGCDLVGMTAMPEAGLARELGIAYGGLSVVVNPAAGKGEREITLDEIMLVMKNATPSVISLLKALCRKD